MKNMKKTVAFLVIVALILPLAPKTVYAGMVYEVGSISDMDAALVSLVSGDTIKLKTDIDYPYGISIDNMTVVFNLNGHVLNISNHSGTALSVTSGGDVQLSGEGALNVIAEGGPFCGVFAYDGSSATVTNASAIGDSSYGAYAASGSSVTVTKNVSAAGIGCYATYADGGGDISINGKAVTNGDQSNGAKVWDGTITVDGDVVVSGNSCYGANVNDGSVTVKGDITVTGDFCQGAACTTISSHSSADIQGDITVTGEGSYGASSNLSGSSILVGGNINAAGDFTYGAQALNEGVITVNGNSTTNGNNSYPVYADGINSMIHVGQDTVASGSGVFAISANNGSTVEVGRNVSAAGIGQSNGAYAYDSTVAIGGDIFAAGNGVGSIGASADSSGVITVNGSVMAEGEDSRGAAANGTGSNISIGKNITAIGDRCNGVFADLNGKISVNGNITAGAVTDNNTVGAKADNGGMIIVNGNTAAIGRESYGAFAEKSGSQIIITQSAMAVGESCIGVFVNSGSITVNRNIAADGNTCFGVKADSSGKAVVNGNITINSTIYGYDSYGVLADNNSAATVGGIITSNGTNNRGVSADKGSAITVDGNVNALYPIILNGLNLDTFTPVINGNYLLYKQSGKNATIRVKRPVTPVISKNPQNLNLNEGEQAVFTVNATVSDDGKLEYQWRKSTNGGSSWSNIHGATGTALTIAAVIIGDNNSKYQCVVSNSKNKTSLSAISSAATLGVTLAAVTPTIQTHPENLIRTSGETAVFTVLAAVTDGGVLTHQWQISNGAISWSNLSGATGSALTITAVDIGDNGSQYRCIVTNTKNGTVKSVYSNAATLTVNAGDTSSGQSSHSKPNPKVSVVTMNLNDLNSAFDKTEAGRDGIKQIKVQMPEIRNVNQYALELPASILRAEEEEKRIEMISKIGTVILPDDMLRGSGIGSTDRVAISLGEGNKSNLPERIKEQIGGRPLIEITLSAGGRPVEWNNPNAAITVSVPYTPTAAELQDPEHIVVWYIDGKGNLVKVPSGRYDIKTGIVTFTTTHFSRYAIAYVIKTFDDLGIAAWARNPVEVLASKGIVEGVSEKEFAPKTSITRGDFLCFLIRALDIETDFEGNFDDVGIDAYYYQEIGAAKRLGITTGIGKNQFRPDQEISRQDMMVMTERTLKMFGKVVLDKEGASLDRFSDYDKVAVYAKDSVNLLVKEGLITGSGSRLNPRDDTTRAEAAVFLYRIYEKYNRPVQ